MSPSQALSVHLDLLRALLEQARADGFAAREALQLALWLIYRILEIDFRCMEAYLYLAYLFCLMQDWTRGCQVLLHADRLSPGHAGIQAMLTRVRFTLQHPKPAGIQTAVTKAEAASGQSPALATILPRLDELRLQLEQGTPVTEVLQQRFDKLGPVLTSLARQLKDLP